MTRVVRRLTSLAGYLRANGPRETARFVGIKARAAVARSDLGWRVFFDGNPFVTTGRGDDYERQAPEVWAALTRLDALETRDHPVDAADFKAYLKRARYERFDPYFRGGDSGNARCRTEKLLEHYLSLQFFDIRPGDVYVDVASNNSPMKQIVRELYGATTYAMDLKYRPGVHGDAIGCDVGAMPMADGSVSHMSLHCSFEHFAYGADCRFLREAERVLRVGGRVCIVPFYILTRYAIRVDPTLEVDISVRDREGATVVYVRNSNDDYGRYYDLPSFERRILRNLGRLKPRMYRFTNLEALEPDHCYAKFALVLEEQPSAAQSTPGLSRA